MRPPAQCACRGGAGAAHCIGPAAGPDCRPGWRIRPGDGAEPPWMGEISCGRGRAVRRGPPGRHGRGGPGRRSHLRAPLPERVFGLAYSMTSDAGVAEDVAQEAMIRVWRHAPVFDPRRGSVTSWVLTITRNLAIDALRLRRAVPTDPDDFAAAAAGQHRAQPRGRGAPGRRPPDGAGGARGAAGRAAPGRGAGRRLRADGARDQRVRGHPARHGQDADQDGPDPAAGGGGAVRRG